MGLNGLFFIFIYLFNIYISYMYTLQEVYNKKTLAFWGNQNLGKHVLICVQRIHEKLVLFAYGWLML